MMTFPRLVVGCFSGGDIRENAATTGFTNIPNKRDSVSAIPFFSKRLMMSDATYLAIIMSKCNAMIPVDHKALAIRSTS
eukprot:scaffold228773_cov51-Attheya_sp.AAC.1